MLSTVLLGLVGVPLTPPPPWVSRSRTLEEHQEGVEFI
jgi:hypothetical protein